MSTPEQRRKWRELYYKKDRNKLTEYRKKYRTTFKGKVATLKAIKKYESNHRERKIAWGKAQCIKLEPCIKCGDTPSHRHHSNLKKPLEIIFLCPLHHKKIHRVYNQKQKL